MALGAQRNDVLGLVLRARRRLTASGIAAGIAVALGCDASHDGAALPDRAGRSGDAWHSSRFCSASWRWPRVTCRPAARCSVDPIMALRYE